MDDGITSETRPETFTSKNQSPFAAQICGEIIKYICTTCLEFSKKKFQGLRQKSGESWTTEIAFSNMTHQRKQEKYHLQSIQHKNALDRKSSDDKLQQLNNLSTQDKSFKTTMNIMRAGMFSAQKALSHRSYTQLCTLLHLITDDQSKLYFEDFYATNTAPS